MRFERCRPSRHRSAQEYVWFLSTNRAGCSEAWHRTWFGSPTASSDVGRHCLCVTLRSEGMLIILWFAIGNMWRFYAGDGPSISAAGWGTSVLTIGRSTSFQRTIVAIAQAFRSSFASSGGASGNGR
jgi:hypothetical protein